MLRAPALRISRYDGSPKSLEPFASGAQLETALDEIARALDGESWLLGGGVAIALAVGGFYRVHSDLDIIIETTNLASVCNRLAAKGYSLYTRKLMKHRGLGVCIFVRCRPSGPLLRMRPRRLCFLSRGATGNPYLDRLDVYLYRETATQYVPLDHAHRLPKLAPVAGLRHRTRSGNTLTCLNLHYVQQFSAARRGPRHVVDLLALSAGLEAARGAVGSSAEAGN